MKIAIAWSAHFYYSIVLYNTSHFLSSQMSQARDDFWNAVRLIQAEYPRNYPHYKAPPFTPVPRSEKNEKNEYQSEL